MVARRPIVYRFEEGVLARGVSFVNIVVRLGNVADIGLSDARLGRSVVDMSRYLRAGKTIFCCESEVRVSRGLPRSEREVRFVSELRLPKESSEVRLLNDKSRACSVGKLKGRSNIARLFVDREKFLSELAKVF